MNTESLGQQKHHNNRRAKKSKLIKGKYDLGNLTVKCFFESKGEMLYMLDFHHYSSEELDQFLVISL